MKNNMYDKWVYLNGDFCLEKDAVLPVTDRGFLFGEGIFTTIRVHKGQCELFQGHMNRLREQAKALEINFDFSHFEWIEELIERNGAREGTWRLKIILTIKQEAGFAAPGILLATLHSHQDQKSESCRLCLFPFPCESPLAHVKSLSYLDHLYVKNYAQRQGYHDAITTTGKGYVLETGCSNLFWIDQEGVCWFPDPKLPYLKGVFLQFILQNIPFPFRFVEATLDQIPLNACLYTCNALTHVRPVLSIGQQSFPRNSQWEEALQQIANNVYQCL